MERLDLDRDEAFSTLRRMSSHLNRKLYEIALEVSSTRRLPDDWSSAGPGRPAEVRHRTGA
jgi:hypothetical protein